jgi:hypothetical protein
MPSKTVSSFEFLKGAPTAPSGILLEDSPIVLNIIQFAMKFGVEDNLVPSSSYDSFKEKHLISEVIFRLENS